MMGVMHERPEDSAPAPQPAPKSSYELPNRKNTSLRNILWALGLTMAIVVVVGISFFGAGSITEQETPENSRVDVAASAERAEAAAGFSVAVPEPGDTWQERSARFDDGQEPRWQIDYTSPQGQLVVLVQGPQLSAAMLSSAVPGAVVEQEQQIDGVDCQVLSGSGDGQGLHAVACDGEGWGFVTRGEGELEELEVLASAAIESLS